MHRPMDIGMRADFDTALVQRQDLGPGEKALGQVVLCDVGETGLRQFGLHSGQRFLRANSIEHFQMMTLTAR